MAISLSDWASAGIMPTPAHSSVNVTTDSTAAIAANELRRYLLLVNDSDTKMYIKLGATAVAAAGIPLAANGGAYEMSMQNGNLWRGAVNAIHGGTGNKVLLVTEG